MKKEASVVKPATKKIVALAEKIRSGRIEKETVIKNVETWIKELESYQDRYSNYPRKELVALSNEVLYRLLEVSILADQFQSKDWPELYLAFSQLKTISGALADYLITTRVMSLN